MITIPCDYDNCLEGQVMVIAEDMRFPSYWITCPKCNGKGTIEVTEEYLQQEIKELEEIRDQYNEDIKRLQGFLKQ